MKELARRVYYEIHGKPKSHQEWCKSFDIVYRIEQILKDEKVK